MENFRVIAHADESDIAQLQEGQDVQVSGEGFDGEVLKGIIQSVGAKAASVEAEGSATYEVIVALPPLSQQQQKRLRLGMSANLEIAIYHTDAGMLVPPEAIQMIGDQATLSYRGAGEVNLHQATVTLGHSTLGGIEVFGIKPGVVEVPIDKSSM